VVVTKGRKHKVHVHDPAFGAIRYSKDEFLRGWALPNADAGFCLLLEPTPEFYRGDEDLPAENMSWKNVFAWFKPYPKFLLQLLVSILLATLLQLSIPLLTQTIVDMGIHQRNMGLVGIILLAQLFLFTSQLSVEFVRNRILLHVNARVNISLITDFVQKLIRLPISFFDSRHLGDIIQRIGDQRRIETFLTTTFVSAVYFVLNVLVFGIVLLIYSPLIFLVFITGFILSTIWILFFMKQRRHLDFKRFDCHAENHSKVVQMITGIADIKLANVEKQKRSEWENIRARLFNVNIKGLSVDQYQRSGAMFIGQAKNLLIIGIAAMAVMNGTLTLGMMMAILFILGQLNSPLQQLVSMARSYQEARISLSRLGEIIDQNKPEHTGKALPFIPADHSISLRNVNFKYNDHDNEPTLKDINLDIEAGKITAVVGASGCGKTTLMKLLLGFYKHQSGNISVGGVSLHTIDQTLWRGKCGAVLQDGYIFTDTVLNNITMNDEDPDFQRMVEAAETACIRHDIEQLPRNYYTVIGQNGRSLSQGQKQRLLIARALYKNPDFLMLDEATNALDANNENSILKNLNQYIKNRTVIVVAHRLSTIRNADSIVVMDQGRVAETGTHDELILKKGMYYKLINNQMQINYEPQLS
jgi:ATP-binding cassette subfamily B protein